MGASYMKQVSLVKSGLADASIVEETAEPLPCAFPEPWRRDAGTLGSWVGA
jgi:hypothetical protein